MENHTMYKIAVLSGDGIGPEVMDAALDVLRVVGDKNKIKFEIVPGVTSAIAVPAYAGIPVTHRDVTSTLAIVTGHEDPEKNKSSIDWAALAKMKSIVFLMGTKNLKKNLKENLDMWTPLNLHLMKIL